MIPKIEKCKAFHLSTEYNLSHVDPFVDRRVIKTLNATNVLWSRT